MKPKTLDNSMTLKCTSSLVSIEWLSKHIGHPDLIILDASLPKPKASNKDNPLAEVQIPESHFFDIDHTFSDTASDLPHTILSEESYQFDHKIGIIHS